MKSALNWLIILVLVVLLVALVVFVLNRRSIYPFQRLSGCRCMRQPGGNRGYCGICGTSGTAYGCPAGQGACGQNCKSIKYHGKACDPCRDSNC